VKARKGKNCTVTTGAAAELRVCADLLVRGFAVYRNVSSAGEVDVIAYANREFWRVQVKSSVGVVPRGDEWDLLALVEGERIRYKDFSGRLTEIADTVPNGRTQVRCLAFTVSSRYRERCSNMSLGGESLCTHHLKVRALDGRVITLTSVPAKEAVQ
jgi:hypothetical protein